MKVNQSQKVEVPRFQHNRHMKAVRSALRAGRLYPQGNIPGTHFCQRLSQPQGHSATGRIMSTKNSNDTQGFEPANFRLVTQCLKQLGQKVTLNRKNKTDYQLDTIIQLLVCFTTGFGLHVSILRDRLQEENINENKCQFYTIPQSEYIIILLFYSEMCLNFIHICI